jgi:hypothetical protein
MVGNHKYLIPDGVTASAVHRFIGFNESKVMTKWSDYWSYATKTTKISAAATFENVALTFAFSKTKGYFKQITKNETKSFGFQGGYYITFALQFRGLQRPPLDPDFKKDIAGLPAAYVPARYNAFVKAWGTHYFTRALYGCSYNLTAVFDNSYLNKQGSKWTSSQLDMTLKVYKFDFGITKTREANRSKIDGSFATNTAVTANARGGDELKFQLGRDFDAWLDSCHTQKVPIIQYSDVEPITNLVADPTKKANLKRAIIAYGQTGRM